MGTPDHFDRIDEEEPTPYSDRRDDLPIFIHSELDDLGLDPYTFRVYARLARRTGGRGGAYESVANMAHACQVSPRRVRYALKALVEKGLIARKERIGATAIYHLEPRRRWKVVPGAAPHAPRGLHQVQGGAAPGAAKGTPLEGSPEGQDLKPSSAEPTLFAEEEPVKPSAKTKSDADLRPYLDAWNQHRGVLPSVKTLTSARARGLRAFIKECPDDPLETFVAAVKVVAQDDFWRKNKPTPYGLDNLLVRGRVIAKAEAVEADPRNLELEVGDRVAFVDHTQQRQPLVEAEVVALDAGGRVCVRRDGAVNVQWITRASVKAIA